MSDSTSETSPNPGVRLRPMLMVDAVLCLLAGLAMGGMALAGPVAVWLGLADFRFGFGTLQIVNGWAHWVALGTLVIAVTLVVLGQVLQVPGAMKMAAMAVVGSISAGLAYYVPETFRPPEGTPAIHDIATDPYQPLEFEAIAPLRADAPNNMEYGVMDGITPKQHVEMQLEAYPDIVPQRYDDSVEEVFNRVMAAIDTLGWEVVYADVNYGRVEATDTTFWFRFKDDVVIELSVDGRQTVLHARSTSRVGISDVGKNAARLRELFALI